MNGLASKRRIIVALDTASLDQAVQWAQLLAPYVGYVKIGLELITAHGAPQCVNALHAAGVEIFFDGKFNDIPNTIAGAVQSVSELGVALFDLHASVGMEAMKTAAQKKGKSKALAVTVLTSIDLENCETIFGATPESKVLQFAHEAAQCGLDGIVCSPRELHLFKGHANLDRLWKVTPGIRPEWAAANDQKRHLGPKEAIQQGATHLVIGRPITNPPAAISGPVEAVKRILQELESV